MSKLYNTSFENYYGKYIKLSDVKKKSTINNLSLKT